MTEALLQIAWAHRLYTELHSQHRLEILDPGTHNQHAGADFLNAKIRIDGILWAGDVELHTHSSGWRAHRHELDEGYTSVILHVCLEGEDEIHDCNGRKIPSAHLTLPPSLIERATELTARPRGCHQHPFPQALITPQAYKDWLVRLGQERIASRTSYWLRTLKESQNDYIECFHRLLFRYFGFGLNNEAMERLARLIPARAIIKQGDNLTQLEALLLGQSGLLDTLPTSEPYIALLMREYDFLANKYTLPPALPSATFRLCRTRPSSFPLRRLLQLALLLHRTHLLHSKVLEINSKAMLLSLLKQPTEHSFWSTYLGSRDRQLTLSSEACISIGINVVAVYQQTMARLRPELEHLAERAQQLLVSLPSERNSIIRHLHTLGLEASNAAESQALIELYQSYCTKRKCLYCPIGRQLLACPSP